MLVTQREGRLHQAGRCPGEIPYPTHRWV